MHISPYEKGNIFNKDPMRVRKLLLHRHEINKIEGSLQEKGLTLVPVSYTHLDVYKRQPELWEITYVFGGFTLLLFIL